MYIGLVVSATPVDSLDNVISKAKDPRTVASAMIEKAVFFSNQEAVIVSDKCLIFLKHRCCMNQD